MILPDMFGAYVAPPVVDPQVHQRVYGSYARYVKTFRIKQIFSIAET